MTVQRLEDNTKHRTIVTVASVAKGGHSWHVVVSLIWQSGGYHHTQQSRLFSVGVGVGVGFWPTWWCRLGNRIGP